MIKKICLGGVLTLVGVIGPIGSQAQLEMIHVQNVGMPRFFFEVAGAAADSVDRSRLYISVKVSNDELQYLKVEDHFEAKYDVDLIVLDRNGNQVKSKSCRQRSIVKTYEQTNSNELMNHFMTQLDLPPGKYEVICKLTDVDSKKTVTRSKKVTLQDFSTSGINISDILFVEDEQFQLSSSQQTSPLNIKSSGKIMKQLFAYFEIYNSRPANSYKISYNIRDFRNRKVNKDKKITVARTGFRTKVFLPIPTQKLSTAQYRLEVSVADANQKKKKSRVFQLRGLHVPVFITNIDQAIDQLRYIANKKDIEKIRKAPKGQKGKYFQEFWKHMDPTPGTPVNELMEEYYRRVEVANREFSRFRAGWKTDMGMIYIIFGAPDDVERQPYNIFSNPYSARQVYAYEIWYYYDIQRRFIFADFQGFGDYSLVNPVEIYERY